MSAPETAAEAIEFLVSHPSVPILSAASLVRDELERLQAIERRAIEVRDASDVTVAISSATYILDGPELVL